MLTEDASRSSTRPPGPAPRPYHPDTWESDGPHPQVGGTRFMKLSSTNSQTAINAIRDISAARWRACSPPRKPCRRWRLDLYSIGLPPGPHDACVKWRTARTVFAAVAERRPANRKHQTTDTMQRTPAGGRTSRQVRRWRRKKKKKKKKKKSGDERPRGRAEPSRPGAGLKLPCPPSPPPVK